MLSVRASKIKQVLKLPESSLPHSVNTTHTSILSSLVINLFFRFFFPTEPQYDQNTHINVMCNSYLSMIDYLFTLTIICEQKIYIYTHTHNLLLLLFLFLIPISFLLHFLLYFSIILLVLLFIMSLCIIFFFIHLIPI